MRFSVLLATVALVLACGSPDRKADSARALAVSDSAHKADSARTANYVALSPLADSIAQTLVFPPRGERWFTGASRAKRLLVDIGRVDANLRIPKTKDIDSARLAAYRQALDRYAPIRKGARFRLRGPWGADDAVVRGYDVWNGRIVATLDAPKRVDSLAAIKEPFPVSAELTDSIRPPLTSTCRRDSIPPLLLARADTVRDSLATLLRADTIRAYDRLRRTVGVRNSRMIGCFPGGRIVLISSVRDPSYEFVSERAVLLDSLGRARTLPIADYRFKAHDGIYAFDADGDGVEDIAAKGMTEGTGGTSILRFVDGKRLERLTSGFAWEGR